MIQRCSGKASNRTWLYLSYTRPASDFRNTSDLRRNPAFLIEPFLWEAASLAGMQVFLDAWLGSMSPFRASEHRADRGKRGPQRPLSARESLSPHVDLNLLLLLPLPSALQQLLRHSAFIQASQGTCAQSVRESTSRGENTVLQRLWVLKSNEIW